MKCATIVLATCVWMVLGAPVAQAVTTVIEPDDYAEGAALTSVAPGITLQTMTDDTTIVPLFTVTANERTGRASTGVKVFGHANVPFWLDFRRLRADFASPVQIVSIDAVGGTNFSSDIGRLEAYGVGGNLLSVDQTSPLPVGVSETMTIGRPSPDISYVVAYSLEGPEGFGPFASLDHLVVNSVPEPAGAALAGLALLALGRRRAR